MGLDCLRRHRQPDPADIDAEAAAATVLDLLDHLLVVGNRHRGQAARIPAAKAATRAALLARLERARSYIEDAPAEPPRLDDLARESGLSKFHLLRLFRACHGLTPGQYAERRRMERAAALLRGSALSAAEIGAHLGYASPTAFGRRFRQVAGLAPDAFRRANRASEFAMPADSRTLLRR